MAGREVTKAERDLPRATADVDACLTLKAAGMIHDDGDGGKWRRYAAPLTTQSDECITRRSFSHFSPLKKEGVRVSAIVDVPGGSGRESCDLLSLGEGANNNTFSNNTFF